MEKRREFTRDTIEVCRNCKAEGKVDAVAEVERTSSPRHVKTDEVRTSKVKCPVCDGSGLVRKHIEGSVTVEPYEKDRKV